MNKFFDISNISKKKMGIAIFLVVFFAFIATMLFYSWSISHVRQFDKQVEIIIARGDSAKIIAKKLIDAQLISSTRVLELYLYVNKLGNQLKAGDYIFSGNISLKTIVSQLVAGDINDDVLKITIPEGWNIKEIDAYLAKIGKFKTGEFSEFARNQDNIIKLEEKYPVLSGRSVNSGLEGYLFPDTYRIYKNATPEEVISKMLDNFQAKLSENLIVEIKRQNKSIFEIITMASVVEKEVRNTEDMKIVAGIFWQRIAQGQALQSCATLAYILGISKAQYSIEDTKIQSPYNTYQNVGLPIGPISNPGIRAIEAAIFPENTSYNYFLTASDGTTIFSKTFEEHVNNKNKYIK